MLFTGSHIKDKMKQYCLIFWLALTTIFAHAQPDARDGELILVKKADHTPVKNQASSGTCWSFSTISLVESQTLSANLGEFDLSEMFIVRNIYLEKARNYILRQGKAQFGSGGLGNDVIEAIARYGAVPESVYSGLLLGQKAHDHSALDSRLEKYLDSLLTKRPIPMDWINDFQSILDDHLGRAPETFLYQEKTYTPMSFAKEVLKFDAKDYVYLTSFTHHPFYQPFVLEIPDNYGGASYYNIPMTEMIDLVKNALSKGQSIMWDADVSNKNFRQREGYALQWQDQKSTSKPADPDDQEQTWDPESSQQLFENLTTQDDHLMHLVGLERSKQGKTFFLVKNSWGEIGPFKGYIKVSETYFAINTISLVAPRESLSPALLSKFGLK